MNVYNLFLSAVEKSPLSTCLIVNEKASFSYQDIHQLSCKLCDALHNLGGTANKTIVGISVERELEKSVIAMLAVLKAGFSFVNIPSELPTERKRIMLSYCDILITESHLKESLPYKSTSSVVLTDSDWKSILETVEIPSNKQVNVTPDFACHLLFTSGSTGQPMPVVTEHSAVINRLEWMWMEYPFREGEVAILKTALTFVDFIWEIFGSLGRGIPLVLVSSEERKDPVNLIRICKFHNVTRLTVVPSLLRAIFAVEPKVGDVLPKLWLWTVSGEALQQSLLEAFHAAAPKLTLLNLYGSTEVAGDVTFVAFTPDCPERNGDASAPQACTIGVAMSGVDVQVRNTETLALIPDGEIGGLYVTGLNLAREYLGFPENTAKRFIILPSGERAFYMGDLGFKENNGSGRFHYTGRRDAQVKIRGQRLNLQEVEKVLTSIAQSVGVNALAVVIQDKDLPEPQLVSFCTPRSANMSLFKSIASKHLTDYQLPLFVALDKLPLLFNGKIDRRQLVENDYYINASIMTRLQSAQIDGESLPFQNDNEKIVASIFGSILFAGKAEFTHLLRRNSDFFELGGTSLSSVQLLAQLKSKGFDNKITMSMLANSSSIQGIASLLNETKHAKETTSGKSFTIEKFTSTHATKAINIAIQSFLNEPLVLCQNLSFSDVAWFMNDFITSAIDNGLSFVAKNADGQIIGFTINEDFFYPVGGKEVDPLAPPPPSESWFPILAFLESIDLLYINKFRGGNIPKGNTVHMVMTGCVPSLDGKVAGEVIYDLESAVMNSAKEMGYSRLSTTCTNSVTAHLSVGEFNYKVLENISYNTFEFGEETKSFPFRTIFQEGRHKEAVLCEKEL